MDTITPAAIIAPFLSLIMSGQFGYLTSRSKVAGVINDKKDIRIEPFKDIIRSRSGVAAAARTNENCKIE